MATVTKSQSRRAGATTAETVRPTPRRTRRLRRTFASRFGPIGVDVGTRSIKLAQVERTSTGWRLAAARVIPFDWHELATNDQIAGGLIANALHGFVPKAFGFRGRLCNCVLSNGIVEPRSSELPDANSDELRSMVMQDNDPESHQVDFWSSPAASASPQDSMRRVTSYSIPKSLGMRIAKDLFSAKLQCQTIDALPFALARASLAATEGRTAAKEPVGAFDWSSQQPIFTISVDGVPKMTRLFRNCSMQRVVRLVEEGLGVNEFQASQLLADLKEVAAKQNGSALQPSPIAKTIHRILQPELERVVIELQRTMAFVEQQYRDLVPNRLEIFGGGSTIGGIAELIEQQIGIKTLCWRLPHEIASNQTSFHVQGLFGAAVGMSLLP